MGNQSIGRICIRVFPEYGLELPLWGAPSIGSPPGAEYRIGPYLPEELPPLSTQLCEGLRTWSYQWTRRVAEDMGEMEPSALSPQERHRQELLWKEQGRQLCWQLQEELGQGYTVIYDVR